MVLELLLDAPRDLSRQILRARVIDASMLDQDADLAAGLDRVGLLHARERVGDLLQGLEALDVDLDALAPRAGTGARERVRGGDQHRPQATPGVVVVVMA